MTRIMYFSYGYSRQIINNRNDAAALLDISMAMRIRRYSAERIAQYGRSRATLDATVDAAIGQVFLPHCPGGHHGHQFRRKKSSCGIVEFAF